MGGEGAACIHAEEYVPVREVLLHTRRTRCAGRVPDAAAAAVKHKLVKSCNYARGRESEGLWMAGCKKAR